MTPWARVSWSGGGPHKSSRLVLMSPAVREQAKAGGRVVGSEIHGIVLAVRPAITCSNIPRNPIPELEHEVVLSRELREELERLVIEGTLNSEGDEPLVIFAGPSGTGKTCAKEYCVSQLAASLDGSLMYYDLPAGYARRSYWGESEAAVRNLFDTALELGEQGYVVFIAFEDAEATLQSRQLSQRSISGCGSTAAATTAEFLGGLGRIRQARIRCTVLVSTNAYAFGLDGALINSHRCRAVIEFGILRPDLVAEVVKAHAAVHDLEDGAADWLAGAFRAPAVLARGHVDSRRCEVSLADCVTPSLIAGVFHRARRMARGGTIETQAAIRAFADEMHEVSRRVVGQARNGEIGILVPRLADVGGLALTPAFDREAYCAQSAVDEVLAPA